MDQATLDHLAALARLELAPDEKARLANQLGSVLEFFRTLETLPTDGVEPTAYPLDVTCPERPDEPTPSAPAERILSGAPDTDGEFYRVPRIVGG